MLGLIISLIVIVWVGWMIAKKGYATAVLMIAGVVLLACAVLIDAEYLDYRCKNPMDAGCPSGSTSSRRFPGGLIFLEAR